MSSQLKHRREESSIPKRLAQLAATGENMMQRSREADLVKRPCELTSQRLGPEATSDKTVDKVVNGAQQNDP